MRAFGDATRLDGPSKRTLETAVRDGTAVVHEAVGQPAAGGRREQPQRRAMRAPVRAEHRQQRRGNRDIPVVLPFAVHEEQQARAIDLPDLQFRAFQ